MAGPSQETTALVAALSGAVVTGIVAIVAVTMYQIRRIKNENRRAKRF
jgi:hypothetical protein